MTKILDLESEPEYRLHQARQSLAHAPLYRLRPDLT